jgi:hypothetical protein
MDITASIAPKSDQLNADDLMTGPATVTIVDVTAGTTEQPFNFNLVEYPGRPYKPSKSMRRVIVACWGPETSTYKGRQLTLYRNPDIKFGGEKVGGIEISHASHIDAPVEVSLTVTRGKRKPFKVEPLTVRDWYRDIRLAGTNIDKIIELGKAARAANAADDVIKEITARYNELKSLV